MWACIFSAASNTQFDLPVRSKVNYNPDPDKARRSRRRGRDSGHVNPGYNRNSSDSSSVGSDVDGRDLSPPRVRKSHLSSDSSYDESSSVDEEIPGESPTYRMEREIDRRDRTSYKKSRQNNLLDPRDDPDSSGGKYRRTNGEYQRMSRRENFERNPRSDSPLTIGSLRKHTERLGPGGQSDQREDRKNNSSSKGRRRDVSPSTKTNEESEVSKMSLTTGGTDITATTTGSKFEKNPRLRRNSPSRSSSHRRYRKDSERDEKGRRRPRRTVSAEREREERKKKRSQSPSSGSERSGSSRSGSSRRSRSEATRINKDQGELPIFREMNKKNKSSVV